MDPGVTIRWQTSYSQLYLFHDRHTSNLWFMPIQTNFLTVVLVVLWLISWV